MKRIATTCGIPLIALLAIFAIGLALTLEACAIRHVTICRPPHRGHPHK